ncbi:hypothetical protein KP509_31G065900 [Ceratopteris richardii]|uniref:Uncharacterized protein n=1 Tax=Ceratopteris richardii TaxID=49495 RepID=A0A8T2R0V1_CERRI|nr:hypothetical protein KP509_31G065900 [Ceratopteris richardii]
MKIWNCCSSNAKILPDTRMSFFCTVYCQPAGVKPPDFRVLLIGESNKMDIVLWQLLRAHILWAIWKDKNSKIFYKHCKDHFFPCMMGIVRLIDFCLRNSCSNSSGDVSPHLIIK